MAKRTPDPVEQAILKQIRDRLTLLGIPLTDFAEKLGRNRQNMYLILSGRQLLRVGLLYRMARVLRVRNMGAFFEVLPRDAALFPTKGEVEAMLGQRLTRDLDAHARSLIGVYRQLNHPNRAKIRRDMRRLLEKQQRGPAGGYTHRPKDDDDDEEED